MSRIAFPFLTLSESAVSVSPWLISLNGSDWVSLGDYLPDWDAASTIHLCRRVAVNSAIAAADINCDIQNLRFCVSIKLGTGQGRLPRLTVHREKHILEAPAWYVNLDLEIEGAALSTVLDIDTRIMLAASVPAPLPLSPSRTGDQLWSERVRTRLEGEEPRFPIEVGELHSLLGDSVSASAPWYLHWSPRDWSRDFHGAMRLYLNPAHTDLTEQMEEENPVVIQMLLGDIMGQVCERFITDPDVEDLFVSSEPGSLAAQAVSWLKKVWPEKDPDFIRSIFDNKPGVFRASLLALADLGDN